MKQETEFDSSPSDSSGSVTIPLAEQVATKPRHFACFDGLRAIAAVSVLLLHAAWVSGFTLRSSVGIYASRLEIGVSVFFLISGFLLYRPFAVSHLSRRASPNARRFWERRLLRIVPAYWLALTVLTYGFHAITLGPGWQGVVIHYLFLQIYFPTQAFFGITQAWSLCTEMSFYFFLPLYAAAVGIRRSSKTNQMRRELVGLGILVVISVGFRWWALNIPFIKVVNGHFVGVCYPHCSTQPPFSTLLVDWLPSYLDLFAFGMLLAVISVWLAERDSEPTWLWSSSMPWLSWCGAAVAFWWVSHLGIPRTVLYIASPQTNILRQGLYGAFAFLLLMPAVFGPQDRSLVRRFLRSWPVASVGVISYGIYLWHLDLIHEVVKWTGWRLGMVPFWLLALTGFGISVAFASTSYFALERPVLQFKNRIRWWDRGSRIEPQVPKVETDGLKPPEATSAEPAG